MKHINLLTFFIASICFSACSDSDSGTGINDDNSAIEFSSSVSELTVSSSSGNQEKNFSSLEEKSSSSINEEKSSSSSRADKADSEYSSSSEINFEEVPSSSLFEESSSSEEKRNGVSSSFEESSSSTEVTSSSSEYEVPSAGNFWEDYPDIQESGFYETNCPAEKVCSYVTTEYLNSKVGYGEILDNRDGQVYKVIKIGSQVWFAQNLNYDYVVKNNRGSIVLQSYCIKNDETYCAKFGRLYTWAATMDSVGYFSDNAKGCGNGYTTCAATEPIRGACPEKWHVASISEWQELGDYVEKNNGEQSAGASLKASFEWKGDIVAGNPFGFSALPAGEFSDGSFSYGGGRTYFWTSTEKINSMAYQASLAYEYDYLWRSEYMPKTHAHSVRCVRDSD